MTVFAAAGAAALCLASRQVDGAETGSVCADPRVHVEGELDARWLAPVIDVCEQLGSMTDVDPSARLRIVAAGKDVIVEATLQDGRTAMRRITRPDDLRLTIEALVTLPPEPPKTAPSKETTTAPLATTTAAQPAPNPTTAASMASIEIGVSGVGRVSGAPTYLTTGPTAYAGLRVDEWLLGVTARWDAYGRKAGGDFSGLEIDGIGAGFLLVRRVARGSVASFDVGASALLLEDSQTYVTPAGDEKSGTSPDARVGLLGRLHVGSEHWRWIVTLDGEVSPSRLRRDIRIDPELPVLPKWSVGLGLGLRWGEP